MATESTIRYCAWCHAYTKWLAGREGEEFCEYDMTVHGEAGVKCENPHSLAVICGGYAVFIHECGDWCDCFVANIGDDGVRCCSLLKGYDRHWEELVSMMYLEANIGTFEAEKWASSFPRRTAEIVGRIRAVVSGALAVALPPVLAELVVGFIV